MPSSPPFVVLLGLLLLLLLHPYPDADAGPGLGLGLAPRSILTRILLDPIKAILSKSATARLASSGAAKVIFAENFL